MKIDGWKTYAFAFALAAYAIGGFAAGKLSFNEAYLELGIAGGMAGIKHKLDRMVD